MANGIISTARGRLLNIDDLIMQGRRPVGRAAKSTRDTANYTPSPAEPNRIRGFVPAAAVSDVPEQNVDDTYVETIPKFDPIASAYTPTGEAQSVSDLTGIMISKSGKAGKSSTQGAAPRATDDESLGSLLGKLNKS